MRNMLMHEFENHKYIEGQWKYVDETREYIEWENNST